MSEGRRERVRFRRPDENTSAMRALVPFEQAERLLAASLGGRRSSLLSTDRLF